MFNNCVQDPVCRPYSIKGLFHEMNIFLKACNIKLVLSVTCADGFQVFFRDEINKLQYLAFSLESTY